MGNAGLSTLKDGAAASAGLSAATEPEAVEKKTIGRPSDAKRQGQDYQAGNL